MSASWTVRPPPSWICVCDSSIGVDGVAEHAHRLARAGDLGPAAGGVDVELAQRRVDLRCGDAERLHPRRVEDHADLAVDAAVALDLGHAVDRQQPLGDRVVDEPAQLLDRHVVGAATAK